MRATIVNFKRDGRGLKTENDEWYTVRNLDLRDEFQAGDIVEFQFTTNKHWNNITDDKVTKVGSADEGAREALSAGKPGGAAKGSGYKRWHAYEDKQYQVAINQRIGRQHAVNAAIEALGTKAPTFDLATYVNTVLNTAEAIAKWTSAQSSIEDAVLGLDVQNPAPPTPKAPVAGDSYEGAEKVTF